LRVVIISIMEARTAQWNERALDGLREAGFRSGGARRAVVEYLAGQTCCRSAQDVFDGIREGGGRVGIASVYRVLDTLAAIRYVQRVEIGDGIARFEPSLPGGEHHHHHLVCADCGSVEPFEDTGLERALVRVAGRHGYAMTAHDVVLHGACASCRAA
jgi:Fur family ferric uptake transcriptional regulator